jgi:hypothetical protein
MEALTPQFLFALALGFGVCGLAMGLWIGRRPSSVDQYAIDFGSMGRKKARARRVVYEQDWVCTIYETDFLYLDRYPHRHIMEVPVDMSAVSFSVGILLTAPESARIEAGDDWPYFERLARDVQNDPFRFRNTPIERPA